MVRFAWSLTACALLVLAVGCQDRSGESAADAAAPRSRLRLRGSRADHRARATRDRTPRRPPWPRPARTRGSANGPDPRARSCYWKEAEAGGYRVTIQSLDGRESYAGDAAGPNIVFERNGKTETLRAGSGKLTGMKWLADKSDCLVIQAGEGFCRDQQTPRHPQQ